MLIKYSILPFVLFLAWSQTLEASWTWDDPQPQGNALFAAASSTGSSPVVVAVGEYGSLVRSTSPGTWSSPGPVASGATLSGIVWAGDRFMACGSAAGLWASENGLTWSQIDSSVRAIRVLPAGGTTIALGTSSAWVSSGGVFAERSLSAAGITSYRGAVSDGSRVLLYGRAGLLATSTDGATWNKAAQSTGDSFYAAEGGSSGFLVGGLDANGSGIIRASADGLAWSALALPVPRFFPVRIFRLPDGWLVQDYYTGDFYRRSDPAASAWTKVESDLPGFYPAASAIGVDGRLLMFGDRGLVAVFDGTRVVVQMSGAIDTAYLYSPRFSAACAGDFVAAIDFNVANSRLVRYFRGVAASSGVAWTKPSPAPVRGFNTLASIGASFVAYSTGATGDTGSGLPPSFAGFYRSTDGLDWQRFGRVEDPDTSESLLQGQVVSMAAKPDESSVVVLTRSDVSTPGGYGAVRGVYRSTDWNSWRQIPLPAFRANPPAAEENMESVVWDGTQFVLLLYPGRVFTSPDGLSWTQLPSLPAGLAAVSVASGSGVFVARTAALQSDGAYDVESSGGEKFFVFSGGRWWPRSTGRRTPVLQRCVIRAGDTFVATGEGAEVLTSTDGFSWSSHPAPGAPYALLWNGKRLFGFNDSFAAFSREGLPSGGASLGLAALSPRTRDVAAAGEAYNLSLDVAAGVAWEVTKIPSWMTVSPVAGTGPAPISIRVAGHTGKSPRGACLEIAGESHLVFQQAVVPLSWPVLAGAGASLKIPLAGDWSIVAPPGIVAPAKGATVGSGPIALAFARNDSTSPRVIVVNINGTDYRIEQEGTPPAVLRAGIYGGLVGYLEEAASSALLDDYTAAFEGSVRVTVAPPGKISTQGSYSAQLTLHNGTKPLVFRGDGALSADGTVANARWSAGPKGPHIMIKSMSVVRDDEGRQYLHGEFENAGFRFGFLAGRNVFSAKTNPLSSDYAGRASFFLTSYGESGTTADGGVGSAIIGADGIAKLSGVLANGVKFTASASLWGALEPQLVLPFAFGAGASRLVCGFSRYDASSAFTDWDGLGALVSPGSNQDDQPQTVLTFLSASLCLYTPPAKGDASFLWSLPATLRLVLPEIDTIEAEVSSPAPNKIALDSILSGSEGAKFSFSFDPRSGLLKGSVVPAPGSKALPFFGAITRKDYSITGDIGGFLGLVPGPVPGRFEISSP
ncbi:MAG: hypothetical protein JHC85_05080 [Chthoniobacterales bacterium]|nr:hypothetical protein [Chthoniobacterales bacterium]